MLRRLAAEGALHPGRPALAMARLGGLTPQRPCLSAVSRWLCGAPPHDCFSLLHAEVRAQRPRTGRRFVCLSMRVSCVCVAQRQFDIDLSELHRRYKLKLRVLCVAHCTPTAHPLHTHCTPTVVVLLYYYHCSDDHCSDDHGLPLFITIMAAVVLLYCYHCSDDHC